MKCRRRFAHEIPVGPIHIFQIQLETDVAVVLGGSNHSDDGLLARRRIRKDYRKWTWALRISGHGEKCQDRGKEDL